MEGIQITRITAPSAIEQPGEQGGDGSFATILREGMDRLGELQSDAQGQVSQLLAGEPVELHRVIMAGEQAALAFEMMTSVRNKLVDAYQEVMRMQV